MQTAENDLNPFYYLDDELDGFDNAHEEMEDEKRKSRFAYAHDLSEMFKKLN